MSLDFERLRLMIKHLLHAISMRPRFLAPLPRLIPASASRVLNFLWNLRPHGLNPKGARQLRLWQAIEAHDPTLLKLALTSGADPNHPVMHSGRLNHPIGEALHQRWLGGHNGLQVLLLLLAAGADPNTKLLDRSHPNAALPHQAHQAHQAHSGEPCLLRALRIGEIPSCLALLDHGADPDALDTRGWGPAYPSLTSTNCDLSPRLFAQTHAGYGGPHEPQCTLFLDALARQSCIAEASELSLDLARTKQPSNALARRL